MLNIKLLAVRKIREHVPGARARAERRKSGAFTYYITRDGGTRSVQTGGSECSNIRPLITPSYGWFCGCGYTTDILFNYPTAATTAITVLATAEHIAHWGNYLVCANYMIDLQYTINEKSEYICDLATHATCK